MRTKPCSIAYWLGRGSVLLLFLALAGCSSRGTVTGKVTYKGAPLPVGRVTFVLSNGSGGTGEIKDGVYTAIQVPTGPAKVTVEIPQAGRGMPAGHGVPANANLPPEAQKMMENARGGDPKTPKIPPKYADPDGSGLTYTVKGGTQTYDIDLQ
jgi:hypothetical protein